MSAIVFLYRYVLKKPVGELEGLLRAKKTQKIPVVLSPSEVARIVSCAANNRLILELLYGTGMRLKEALRLRVKDLDWDYRQIVVRDGKGKKDRVTILPEKLKEELQRQRIPGLEALSGSTIRRRSASPHRRPRHTTGLQTGSPAIGSQESGQLSHPAS